MTPTLVRALAERSTLALVAALGATYFLLGRLSLLLAIPPGFASAVWPAAGVSVMALLLGGRRLWPGVLLGSFLVNFLTTARESGAEPLAAATVPALIGLGAALQALLGAWAIERWVEWPTHLARGRDILRILALGGPVSCLVNATVGVAALVASRAILAVEAPFHWWTWWVGDSIGVLLVVPLALAFTGDPARTRRHRPLRVVLPLAVTTGAVIAFFLHARDQEWRRLDLELSHRALALAHAFEKHIERSLDDLASIEGLFAGGDSVSRQDFARFAERILDRNPTFQALSWNPVVASAERAELEAAGRADGFAGYRFREAAPAGELRPAQERSTYVVVHYIEPYAGNEPALGFDIASDPFRRAAAETARDMGRPVATAAVRLVQEPGEQAGVLLLMPVYAAGARPAALDERRRALRGYATGVIRIGDALRAALADLPREGFTIALVDLTESPTGAPMAALGDAPEGGPSRFSWTFDRDVAGRLWSLRIAPTPRLLVAQRHWYVWWVLAGGLGLVSLLGVQLLAQSGREEELAALNARLADALDRRRRLERQREGLIAELELRNSELERFSYSVSHDLKGPLITIKGFLDLLERRVASSADVAVEIAQLHRAADRMRELIDDLLELSRAGRTTGPAEVLDLGALAREALDHLGGRRLAAGVEIEVEIRPHLPLVEGHRSQLLEVLQNLLDNAIKFTAGRPDPRVVVDAAAQGERVVCSVSDNGIGLDPAHRERIFGLFTRLDPAGGGTGVGLALVRRIVEMNGGSVWVESEGEGHGCAFYFSLPAAGRVPRGPEAEAGMAFDP